MTIYKRFRLEKGISQIEMAKKLKISINAYRNYEQGKRVMPYKVLISFLELRGEGDDKRIATIIKGVLKND